MTPKSENNSEETSREDNTEEKTENGTGEESPEEVEVLEEIEEVDELAERDAEIARLKDEMLRTRAEAENFRRRMAKDKEDAIQFANEKLIKDLLPVFDNLHRALEAPDANVDSLKQGVQMTADQFLALLKKQNVESISSVGEKFDPNIHEVLNQVESDEHEEGTVVQEYMKGYTLNGRVLIPAKVATAKKPATPKQDEAEEKEVEA